MEKVLVSNFYILPNITTTQFLSGFLGECIQSSTPMCHFIGYIFSWGGRLVKLDSTIFLREGNINRKPTIQGMLSVIISPGLVMACNLLV